MRLFILPLFLFVVACGGSKSDAPAEPAAEPAPVEAEATPDAPPPEAPADGEATEAEATDAEAEGDATGTTADEAPTTNEGGAADGASCLTGSDCASGICEGIGCGDDTPGACMPQQRPCTRDLRPMCDCEGNTFQASSSCPKRRVEKKVPCDVTVP